MLVSGPCIGPRAAACWHVSPIPYSFRCNVGRRSTPLRNLQIDTLKQQQQHRAASAGRLKATSEQVQLLNPVATERLGQLPLLVYCPGSDGTGNSIAPQLPGLTAAGFDVRCIYIPMTNRSEWEELTRQVVSLIRRLIAESAAEQQVTLVAESFGGCLGLRVAAAAPDLVQRLLLVNPATSFAHALGGLPAAIAASNLLSLFPAPLYQVAQAVLVPLLVDKDNVGPAGLKAIQSMMVMQPAPDFVPTAGFVDVRGAEDMSESAADAGNTMVSADLRLYKPAVTAAWRLRMMRKGNLPDAELARIRAPTLIVASAADRLLPSLEESRRLVAAIPDARRVVLPTSGHTALLESGVCLAAIMARTGFLPQPPAAQQDGAREPSRMAVATAHNQETEPSYGRAERVERSEVRTAAAAIPATRVSDDSNGNGSSSATMHAGANGTSSEQSADLLGVRVAGFSAAAALNGNGKSSTHKLTGASSNGNGAGRSRAGTAPAETLTGTLGAGAATALNGKASGAADVGKGVNRPQGAVWGQGARGRGNPSKSRVDENYETAIRVAAPLRALLAPVVRGAENIPDGLVEPRGVLFVGNHTRFGLYDLPFLMMELHLRGHNVRGLAHPAHWQLPTGDFFEGYGAVRASPMAAYRLLKQGDSTLLFPGGGREVNKRKGEEYKLLWRESPEFVRLAAKCNALIVPFAAVGGDDAFDIAVDTDELLQNPILGPLARGAIERVAPGLDPDEALFPLTRGPLGLPSLVPLPKLQRLYFRFMPPVDPAQSLCSVADAGACMAAYSEVRASVEAGIQQLLAEREVDPERDLLPRLAGQASRFLPAFELASGR